MADEADAAATGIAAQAVAKRSIAAPRIVDANQIGIGAQCNPELVDCLQFVVMREGHLAELQMGAGAAHQEFRETADALALHDEVFGPLALVVSVRSLAETLAVLQAVQGSLTVTLWGADADTPDNRSLVRAAQRVAGRVLFAGVPTGVAVTAAQQHGGPWPSSTAPFTTSVGYAALDRFLRPLALQDAPGWLVEARGLV